MTPEEARVHSPSSGAVPDAAAASRVFLRPIASPFALGFLGLAIATTLLAGQELSWIPTEEWVQVALLVILTAPVLQLVACVFGFLARDAVAATGMGVLAVTWLVIGVDHAIAGPAHPSVALGTALFVSAFGLGISATVAAHTKVLPAIVMGVTALRFFTTALYEVSSVQDVKLAAGVLGCILAFVAIYAALALEIEGLEHRPVVPTLRRGRGAIALEGDFAEQIRRVEAEPGVRNQL